VHKAVSQNKIQRIKAIIFILKTFNQVTYKTAPVSKAIFRLH